MNKEKLIEVVEKLRGEELESLEPVAAFVTGQGSEVVKAYIDGFRRACGLIVGIIKTSDPMGRYIVTKSWHVSAHSEFDAMREVNDGGGVVEHETADEIDASSSIFRNITK